MHKNYVVASDHGTVGKKDNSSAIEQGGWLPLMVMVVFSFWEGRRSKCSI
jgi:hypothetical protein